MSNKLVFALVLLVVALGYSSGRTLSGRRDRYLLEFTKDFSTNMDHLSKILHSLGTTVEVFSSFCNSTYSGNEKISAYLDCNYNAFPESTFVSCN